MEIVNMVEKKYMKAEVTNVSIGDQVEVSSKIVEGDKERVQKFIGTVIAKRGNGIRAKITVRRIVQGEGAERIFPIHSPHIQKIEVIKSSKVRRAKLYYLRDRKGKETRLKEKFSKVRVKKGGELKAKVVAPVAAKVVEKAPEISEAKTNE